MLFFCLFFIHFMWLPTLLCRVIIFNPYCLDYIYLWEELYQPMIVLFFLRIFWISDPSTSLIFFYYFLMRFRYWFEVRSFVYFLWRFFTWLKPCFGCDFYWIKTLKSYQNLFEIQLTLVLPILPHNNLHTFIFRRYLTSYQSSGMRDINLRCMFSLCYCTFSLILRLLPR